MNRMISEVSPEIHYRKQDGVVVLTGCYGTDGKVVIPEDIEGAPVTAIAPYAFSNAGEDKNDLVWRRRDIPSDSSLKRQEAQRVSEIYLPESVSEIGRYAFYRCRNLRKLTLSDSVKDIGGGAFTGCRFSEVEIYCSRGEKSALKSILDENRFAIRAVMHYAGGVGTVKTAKVLFPEHYEEAVENTPARLLETHRHGAGGYYRQCFFDRELNYGKYDELLPWAIAQESAETVAELVLSRLFWPYRLTARALEVYEAYIGEHPEDVAVYLVKKECAEGIRILSERRLLPLRALECAIDEASNRKDTELLSILMDIKHHRYPKKNKEFDL